MRQRAARREIPPRVAETTRTGRGLAAHCFVVLESVVCASQCTCAQGLQLAATATNEIVRAQRRTLRAIAVEEVFLAGSLEIARWEFQSNRLAVLCKASSRVSNLDAEDELLFFEPLFHF